MKVDTLEFVRSILAGDFGPYANPEGRIADILDANGQRLGDKAAEIDALTAQLAEARAEVERLRLKANAWDTHRRAMFLTGEQDAALLKHEFECEDAIIESWEAEAKERGISPFEISGYTDMHRDQHERILEGYYAAMDAAARAAKESQP